MMRVLSLLILLTTGVSLHAQDMKVDSGFVTFKGQSSGDPVEATNDQLSGTVNLSTGDVHFQVDVAGFDLKPERMHEHYLDTNVMYEDAYPIIEYYGQITSLENVDFKKDGEYRVRVKGQMTIRGVTKEVIVPAKLKVKDGVIHGESRFELDRLSFGVLGKQKWVGPKVAVEVEFVLS